ncbi:hypothetical protein B0H63DRAFT_522799 [Podospora didyma]|uniref:Cyanovirin-N domain-containing protein n=1 Tax=Podospora didyma TaxID=330526 RepID=A0AAE0NPV7_9PEZI|nr:hypothetical protein B0H63DRAFT_522799 [Podospora didyma]
MKFSTLQSILLLAAPVLALPSPATSSDDGGLVLVPVNTTGTTTEHLHEETKRGVVIPGSSLDAWIANSNCQGSSSSSFFRWQPATHLGCYAFWKNNQQFIIKSARFNHNNAIPGCKLRLYNSLTCEGGWVSEVLPNSCTGGDFNSLMIACQQ